MRRENKRVEFRKSKKLKFSTFRILKIINDKSFSTALNSFQPMIQNHSKNHWFLMILNYFEQLNRAGNSSRKIKIIKMSNKIFRHLVQSFPPGFHESSDHMAVHEKYFDQKARAARLGTKDPRTSCRTSPKSLWSELMFRFSRILVPVLAGSNIS